MEPIRQNDGIIVLGHSLKPLEIGKTINKHQSTTHHKQLPHQHEVQNQTFHHAALLPESSSASTIKT